MHRHRHRRHQLWIWVTGTPLQAGRDCTWRSCRHGGCLWLAESGNGKGRVMVGGAGGCWFACPDLVADAGYRSRGCTVFQLTAVGLTDRPRVVVSGDGREGVQLVPGLARASSSDFQSFGAIGIWHAWQGRQLEVRRRS
ncbi:uncharacterized protein CCOS01_02084 [Colletotrichum costaricense]|uniref:Uncharacterized protein n=1 Tax=Colletotrichum costaricense TaxID=1209916 RepID=A0AAI9Z7B1_9PEZI|nr:uncharacterized protein CCOS01_02084 [Colletotrichum costaricense]KAK1536764.1 hypothetical protein CCOS01_02084 [Colletotrichum costaricense]